MRDRRAKILFELYHRLYQAFGPRHWWPADSSFEVAVGAILTQNTAWKNVKTAISNLKQQELLSPEKLHAVSVQDLATHIRPSGYYNIKARRLKNFISFLMHETNGDMDGLLKRELLPPLREALLSVNGIGPETADSILLYAGNRPTFVIDTYTKRILFRHRLAPEEISYEEARSFFMDSLPADPVLFNEYHALLVHLGHVFCLKRNPRCSPCPARGWNEP